MPTCTDNYCGTDGVWLGPKPGDTVPLTPEVDTEGVIRDIIDRLTGQIDSGALAQELREKIERITGLETTLAESILERIQTDALLSETLAQVQSSTGEALTYYNTQMSEVVSDQEAILHAINVMAAGMSGNAAAITEESRVRTSVDSATTERINNMYSTFEGSIGAIRTEQTTLANKNEVIVNNITGLVTRVGMTEGAISEEANLRTSADSTIANNVTQLAGKVGTTESAIKNIENLTLSPTSALAKKITTAEVALFGSVAQGEVGLKVWAEGTDNKIKDIGAMWTAKVDVNGLIGGFGIYNDGRAVEAGFDVDRFWIGLATNKVKPFIIDAGTVYMDKAIIRNADIDTLKIANNAVTVPLGSFFGSCTSASFSTSAIPTDTPTLITVSWSNPLPNSHLTVSVGGSVLCDSDINYGASSFTMKIWSSTTPVSITFSSLVHGVIVSAIGCQR